MYDRHRLIWYIFSGRVVSGESLLSGSFVRPVFFGTLVTSRDVNVPIAERFCELSRSSSV